MFLFFTKCLRGLNSEVVGFSGGSRTLEKFLCEVSAVSNSPALIKDILISRHVLYRGKITQKVVKILSIQSIQALMKN